jgi:hypothetical protein
MKEMKSVDEINKKIESLENQLDSINNEKSKINEEIRKLKLDLINLPWEGKYIKYVDEFDSTPIYMKVEWIKPNPNHGDNIHTYSYIFKGFGFFGEFFGHDDNTDFDWSYWFEFNISGNYDNFRNKIAKIKVIDQKEFNEAFENMINSVKEYHYKHYSNKE